MLPQALSMLPHLPTSWVSLNAFLHDELAAWLRVRLGRRPVGRKGPPLTYRGEGKCINTQPGWPNKSMHLGIIRHLSLIHI